MTESEKVEMGREDFVGIKIRFTSFAFAKTSETCV
jgi:hypothetical protein